MTSLKKKNIIQRWKKRPPVSHKGNFGKVLILAGSKEMPGAAYLAGLAALRTGAGLVTLGVPESIYAVTARRQPELMIKPFACDARGAFSLKAFGPIIKFLNQQDAVALGPGMSQNPGTQQLIRKLVPGIQKPLVLDADGLNAFKGRAEILRRSKTEMILTPHPGEFLRLFGGVLSGRDQDRKTRALQAAAFFKKILVLKGHHTVVANPDGQVYINPTGNPGMATAGSGDVLTGILLALIGQGFSLWDSARLGVYLHGLSGDLAAREVGEVSLMATDLLDYLPKAIMKTRKLPWEKNKKGGLNLVI